MTFECPNCGPNLQSEDFKIEWGHEIQCRLCGAALRYATPYHQIILLASLPVLVAALALRGFEQGLGVSILMVVAWLVGSLWLAALLFNLHPQKLEHVNQPGASAYPAASTAKR